MNKKASINRSKSSHNNKPVTLQNVIEVVIENYDANPLTILYKDVATVIPPATMVNGVMMPSFPYKFDCLGHPFDIEFLLVFPKEPGNAVINYSTLKNC